ncbi:MAG: aldehyde dehydrogenase family protein [Salegentibacter sp.]|uniref:Aldehyde dehydrogenase (NAD+) n=1 Tax=Salegentibacter flavus TaxID=287099 RepID=A0A1I5D0H0_9FLAO|nr:MULTISPECIES: aldehyde dehydrogenase family protein [Salegentibacter]MDR9458250.1 aldehyde dehydrogenase family protein [Salegentibacter sp.]SFN92730.1 aldehyde dehydrogenase (NAD+) [Salegentibacter flavus]
MENYENLNKQYINGEWVEGNDNSEIKNVNPYDNSEINTFKGANKEDVDRAYKAAKQAAIKWRKSLPQERSAVIQKAVEIISERKEEIIDWLIKEGGSTRVKAEVEIQITLGIMKESASFPTRSHGYIYDSFTPGKESRAYRKPLGVIGIISPWNFPMNLSMRSVAPAIVTGNTVVLKPASSTPVTGATLVAKIFEEAGLPKGVLNAVVGKGSSIGDDFVKHPIPNHISFTGSTPVGRNIGKIAGENLKEVSLELGGNNIFVVMEDADIDLAVEAATFGKFMNQGQICMSVNRFVIHEDVADEFIEKFIKATKKLKYGNPAEEGVLVGPLIDHDQVERILKDIEASTSDGATIKLGGKAEGNVLEPTIIDNVKDDMPIAANEIFGPVAPILRYSSEEDALKIANSKDFGLTGAVFTRNTERGVAFARKVETGMIHINDQTVNDEPNAPFGGEKGSGIGRFNGKFILEKFTRLQWVTVQHEPRDYSPFA